MRVGRSGCQNRTLSPLAELFIKTARNKALAKARRRLELPAPRARMIRHFFVAAAHCSRESFASRLRASLAIRRVQSAASRGDSTVARPGADDSARKQGKAERARSKAGPSRSQTAAR